MPSPSSADLAASEILAIRALAIACFYAVDTAIGGSVSPLLFGPSIETGSAWKGSGYVPAATLLLVAAEWKLGIDAEGTSLESIADSLSS